MAMNGRVRVLETGKGFAGQKEALRQLALLIERDSTNPKVVTTARALVMDCNSRDDICEVQAIFDSMKNGNPAVRGFERGVRYTHDPRKRDFFVSPSKAIDLCEEGACRMDCDEQAALAAGLLAGLGFVSGVKGWGPMPKTPGGARPPLSHVYCVVRLPKKNSEFNGLSGFGVFNEAIGCEEIGLDTTVEDSTVGWEPPGSTNTLTAWVR